MTRSRKRALIITGILMALPVLFLVEEHFRGKWALAKYKRELVAKGEKLTVDECRPPMPDAAENGFGELMGAAAMMDSGTLYKVGPPSMRAVAPGKAQVVFSLTEWPMRDTSARDPATNSNWQILEKALMGSRDAIDAAKVALRKPGFDARVSYSLLNFQMAHLAPVKRAAQCFSADALLQLHRGRPDDALDDVESLLRLSKAMSEERMLISQLVRYAIAGLGVSSTWQALQTPGWSDAQLARLQQAWLTNDFLAPALRALEMERAMAIDSIAVWRQSNKAAADMTGSSAYSFPMGIAWGANTNQTFEDLTVDFGERGSALLIRGVYVPLWQFAWSYEDEQYYLEMVQRLLDGARAAEALRSMKPSSEAAKDVERRSEQQSIYARIRHLSSGMLGETLGRFFTRAAGMQAQRDLAITAIALKRYQLRHGGLLPDLGALVPEFLAEVPRDIFDGKPLRYRLSDGGGFLLYSVGKNETDDGGDPKPLEGGNNFSFQNGRDVVWPQPATAREIEEADEKQKRGSKLKVQSSK